MTFLLSWQGTLLCSHKATGRLVQRPVAGPLDDAELVDIGVPADQFHVTFGHYLRADDSVAIDIPHGPLRGWRIVRASDGRSLNLTRDGSFLSSTFRSDSVAQKPSAADWEGFLPLSPSDLDIMRQVLATNWLIRTSGELVAGGGDVQARMAQFFNVRFGSWEFNLRWQFPFDLSEWPNRLTVLRDAWRIEQICRYRPLVYYSAFGNKNIMDQFALSVRSLLEFGRYEGDIAVLTDHEPAEIARMLPKFDRPRCTVLRCDARDRMSFMAARYAITDWPDAWNYQPILYVDTDIVFDNDVAPVLRAIARSDRISAPIEPLSPLRTSAPSGAGLLQLDGCAPGSMHGFNSGTLGIPNMAKHANTLRLISRLVANHASAKGRDALPFVDQEIANYVSYRVGDFDTALISRHVRYAGSEPQPADLRVGVVHFWAVEGAGPRLEVMQNYMRLLGSASYANEPNV